MTKRRKIILVSLLLSLGLVFVQWGVVRQRYLGISILSILSYFLSVWVLKGGIKRIHWLTVFLLPAFFTAGVGFFFFLLPAQWLPRLSVVFFYTLGIYILLLTENIFSVASERSIQLTRAAQATAFLLILVTAFLLFDTVFSFRLDFWVNFLAVFLISFFLFLHGLWSSTFEERFSPKILTLALVFSFILGEFALAISFWPLTVATSSLFLITVLYILLGLAQNLLQERLFKKTIQEFLWVGIIVFLTIFFTTQWGG